MSSLSTLAIRKKNASDKIESRNKMSYLEQLFEYIENISNNITRMIIMGLAFTIGISVPDSYYDKPISVVIVGFLISSLLFFWQKALGSPVELDSEKYVVECDSVVRNILEQHSNSLCCASNISLSCSSSQSNVTNSKFTRGSKYSSIVYSKYESNKIIIRAIDDTLSYDLHGRNIVSIVCLESSSIVTSADESGEIRIWNSETLETSHVLNLHSAKILSLTLHKLYDSTEAKPKNIVISCCLEGKVFVWDMNNGESISMPRLDRQSRIWPPEITSRISAAVGSLNKSGWLRCAVGTSLGSVYTWSNQTVGGLALLGHYGQVTAMTILDERSTPIIISASSDWTLRIWEFDSGAHLRTLQGHSGSVDCLSSWIGPTDSTTLIVSTGKDATIRVWDLCSGSLYRTLEGHTQEIVSLLVARSLSCSGDREKPVILSSSCDQTMRVWDLDKLIKDIKWNRRKSFILFYSQLIRIFDSNCPSGDLSPMVRIMCIALVIPDIRQAVATYL